MMERFVPLLVLLLGLVSGAAAATGADAQAACEPTTLATQIALFCAPDMPTAPCCEPVVASVDLGGGVPCLCRVAAQPQLILARLNATHLLSLYTACGGLRTGGAHIAAACQGPSPPAIPVITPPPAGPRHRLPSHEAPPPPAIAKPSPPPQQQPRGSVQGKAVPALPPAPASQVPAAAPMPPPKKNSGSEKRPGTRIAYWLLLAIIIFFE